MGASDARTQSQPSERGHAGGFQFGGFGNQGLPRQSANCNGSNSEKNGYNSSTDSVESEIKATLEGARVEGTATVRKILKKLLLRWHPDKLPQGDGTEDAAARDQATRILRFIL